MIVSFLAICLAATGTACLYAEWRHPHLPALPLVLAGWLLVAVSLGLWIYAAGAEHGTVYGLLTPVLCVWGYIAITSRRQSPRSQAVSSYQLYKPTWSRVAINTGRFLFLVPGLGVASIVISVALAYLLPWQEANRLALVVVLIPILWALMMLWYFAAARSWWTVGALWSITLGAGALIFFPGSL